MNACKISGLFLLAMLLGFSSLSSASVPSCSLFLKSKGPLEIRVIFGYKDARPARFVGDRHERLAFIEKLTLPCKGDNRACGFARDPQDSEMMTKTILAHGHPRLVRAVVVNSSVGTDDEENRKDAFQIWKSAHAEDTFLSGLNTADVVLYNGHSRFGGGPDFAPPILKKDGTINTVSYSAHRDSYKRMVDNLSEGNLKVLGLYSCTSTQHFERGIHKVSKASFVSSRVLMYYSDALTDSLKTIDEILHGSCVRSF